MTGDERTMAIALAKVTFIPGIPSKALARKLGEIAEGSEPTITEGQAIALRSLVVRCRRQIRKDVVAIAQRDFAVKAAT